MYCRSCGKQIPDASKFCQNCGQDTPNAIKTSKSSVSPEILASKKTPKISSANKNKKHRSGKLLKIVMFLVLSMPILAILILLVVTISKSL